MACDFVSEIALQHATPLAAGPQDAADRVSLSTIHRAKGLEWRDVYSPFLNEVLRLSTTPRIALRRPASPCRPANPANPN